MIHNKLELRKAKKKQLIRQNSAIVLAKKINKRQELDIKSKQQDFNMLIENIKQLPDDIKAHIFMFTKKPKLYILTKGIKNKNLSWYEQYSTCLEVRYSDTDGSSYHTKDSSHYGGLGESSLSWKAPILVLKLFANVNNSEQKKKSYYSITFDKFSNIRKHYVK